MERLAYWFAWLNLVASSAGWAATQIGNETEPPIVLALSWYAIWQGSLIFIITAHVDKRAKEDEDA